MPFGFYRADYPESNDDYFVFLAQYLKVDEIEFKKIDIKSWFEVFSDRQENQSPPNTNTPMGSYKERYKTATIQTNRQ